MADLNPAGGATDGSGRRGRTAPWSDDSGRAQLILVAGFGLAVTLIVLALVMNSAIYTENIATRSESAGTTNAHNFQRATAETTHEAFEFAHDNDDGSRSALETSLSKSVAAYSNVTTRQYVTTGQVVNASVTDVDDGTNITENAGEFTSASGASDWTVATTSSGDLSMREFRMKIDSWLAGSGDSFAVEVTDGSGSVLWSVTVSDTGGQYEVTVDDGATVNTCYTTSSLPLRIDVSEGTVDGTDCSGLGMSTRIAAENLDIDDGDHVTGQYTVVTNSVESDNAADPSVTPALYDATVEMSYRTDDLQYRSTVRVAPGEWDG